MPWRRRCITEKGTERMADIRSQLTEMGRLARQASIVLAGLSTEVKNKALVAMADALVENQALIIRENERDLGKARELGLSPAMIDRLTLNEAAIGKIARGLAEVAALPDPVGKVTSMWKRPNGLVVGRMRIPLGVIGIIYESRPNVTADAAALCLKSGNAVILRGGSEAIHSNLAICLIIRSVL